MRIWRKRVRSGFDVTVNANLENASVMFHRFPNAAGVKAGWIQYQRKLTQNFKLLWVSRLSNYSNHMLALLFETETETTLHL